MNKIVLNNSNEPIEIISYNRNSTIDDDGNVNSYANLVIPSDGDETGIEEYMGVTITDIKLFNGDGQIYHLSNLNAKVTGINESLFEDHVEQYVAIQISEPAEEE